MDTVGSARGREDARERPVGERFVAAVRAGDLGALGGCLGEGVRLRALLPSGLVEAEGRGAAVALLAGWLRLDGDGEPGRVWAVVDADAKAVGPRLRLSYRISSAPRDGDGDGDGAGLVMEQQAYGTLDAGGREITALRVLCSGTVPAQPSDAA
jgi:hypothetical protein